MKTFIIPLDNQFGRTYQGIEFVIKSSPVGYKVIGVTEDSKELLSMFNLRIVLSRAQEYATALYLRERGVLTLPSGRYDADDLIKKWRIRMLPKDGNMLRFDEENEENVIPLSRASGSRS